MTEPIVERSLEKNGYKANIKYPLRVAYCGECTLPYEYCSFYPTYAKCKEWMEKNDPDTYEKLFGTAVGRDSSALGEANKEEGEGTEAKKSTRQKRGGKGLVKTKKKAEVDKHVHLFRANRGKKKFVTVVSGLATFDVDLKDAAKFFSSKFACGSSVTGTDEIVIQGDVKDDLFDIISEKWPEIDEDFVEDMGDKKL